VTPTPVSVRVTVCSIRRSAAARLSCQPPVNRDFVSVMIELVEPHEQGVHEGIRRRGRRADHACEEAEHAQVVGAKDYITPSGLQRLKTSDGFCSNRERRAVTEVVALSASNDGAKTRATLLGNDAAACERQQVVE
jgi:hypothetical protein